MCQKTVAQAEDLNIGLAGCQLSQCLGVPIDIIYYVTHVYNMYGVPFMHASICTSGVHANSIVHVRFSAHDPPSYTRFSNGHLYYCNCCLVC